MASATGTSGWGGKWAAVVVSAWAMVAVASGGCRGCAEDNEATADAHVAQPAMPTGMLMPGAGAGADASADARANANANGDALRVARGIKGGAWVELQIARPGDGADCREFSHWSDSSWFVSLEAITKLHEPFARALPGFDLFLPRLFSPDALVKLGDELAAFAAAATGDVATTAKDLAQVVRQAAAKKQSLWVIGPP